MSSEPHLCSAADGANRGGCRPMCSSFPRSIGSGSGRPLTLCPTRYYVAHRPIRTPKARKWVRTCRGPRQPRDACCMFQQSSTDPDVLPLPLSPSAAAASRTVSAADRGRKPTGSARAAHVHQRRVARASPRLSPRPLLAVLALLERHCAGHGTHHGEHACAGWVQGFILFGALTELSARKQTFVEVRVWPNPGVRERRLL